MKKDKYAFTNFHTEGWSDFSIELTDDEAEVVAKIVNGLNENRDNKYAPHITMTNVSLNERERQQKLEEEKIIAEQIRREEAAAAEQKRIEDIRENGAMAQAFKKAMEKKKNQ